MKKGKRKSDKSVLSIIALATAILGLVGKLLDIVKTLLE